jgi:hypothetical protein
MSEVATRSPVEELQAAMLTLPQAELETRHYFADGMYLRELPRPAGCTIVGKVHKKEHFYMVVSGEVTVIGDGVRETVVGPRIFVCKPGTKRAVYAHTDAVCITVHRVSSEDLGEIEEELVVADPSSPYLPGNKLKQLEKL